MARNRDGGRLESGVWGLWNQMFQGVSGLFGFLKAALQNATFDKAVLLPSKGEFEYFCYTNTESKP